MLTSHIVILLFLIACIAVLLEPYMGKYNLPVYIVFGFVLIVVAGLREIGLDPDSVNYEDYFLHYDAIASNIIESLEPTYTWIAFIVHLFTNDVHGLFLIYAALGVSLKFIALRRLTGLWFLPVVTYLGYYFIAHEMMQIRTGVLSGLLLLGIYYQTLGQKWKALLCIAIGSFFHYSGLLFLPTLLLSSKEMSTKQRWLWLSIIPLSYAIYYSGFVLLMSADLPYIGSKLAAYQAGTEKGIVDAYVNLFRPLHLLMMLLLAYIMYYYDVLVEKNKHVTLLLKLFCIGIASYQIFAFLPVLAQRVNQLFLVVTIPLYAFISYTLLPKWAAAVIVMLIAFIFLNYSLPLIGTTLLWSGT